MPKHIITCLPLRLEDWLELSHQKDIEGIIIDTDYVTIAELRTVSASLNLLPQIWCILLVGDRGIVGFEKMILKNHVKVLPKPWTPNGLKSCLKSLNNAEDVNESHSNLLPGLIEGFRDPLTSILGNLELATQTSDASKMLENARTSTNILNEHLKLLELLSFEVTPHNDYLELNTLIKSLEKDLKKIGHTLPPPNIKENINLYTEPRYAKAALMTSYLLLQRFGPPGNPIFQAKVEKETISLFFSKIQEQEIQQGNLAPPIYYEELINSFAHTLQAESYLVKIDDAIPLQAGITFKR